MRVHDGLRQAGGAGREKDFRQCVGRRIRLGIQVHGHSELAEWKNIGIETGFRCTDDGGAGLMYKPQDRAETICGIQEHHARPHQLQHVSQLGAIISQ